MQFKTATYHRLCSQLRQLAAQHCGGRLLFFLEGGYNLTSLAASVADSMRGVVGEGARAAEGLDVDEAIYEEPSARVDDVIAQCRAIHSL